MKLRDYQVRIKENLIEAVRAGNRKVIIQAPTGAGKTILVSDIVRGAYAKGNTVWFLVHRRELVEQSMSAFSSFGIPFGLVGAGYPIEKNARVQICSVDSLRNRIASLREPNLIIVDEAHHLGAATWTKIYNSFPNSVRIGVTATPERLDGKGLASFCDSLIIGPSVKDLIESKYLSPYQVISIPSKANLSNVKGVKEFNAQSAFDELKKGQIMGDVVDHYRKYAMGESAVFFGCTIQHSLETRDAFIASGIRAEHLDGGMTREQRFIVMKKFREGEIDILCNVGIVSEGLDVPEISAVIMGRMTKSLGLYLQMIGRALRYREGKIAKIIDHVGNVERHGFPCDDRKWNIEGSKARKKDEKVSHVPPIRRCPSCFRAQRVQNSFCEYCGEAFNLKKLKIEKMDGKLVEVDSPEYLKAVRKKAEEKERQKAMAIKKRIREAETIDDFNLIADDFGYKRGWAWHKYNSVMKLRSWRR